MHVIAEGGDEAAKADVVAEQEDSACNRGGRRPPHSHHHHHHCHVIAFFIVCVFLIYIHSWSERNRNPGDNVCHNIQFSIHVCDIQLK